MQVASSSCLCAPSSGTDEYLGEIWAELLQALFVSSQSQDPGQREIAFRIFQATPGVIQKQHEETVRGAFSKGCKDADVSVSRSLDIAEAMMLTEIRSK